MNDSIVKQKILIVDDIASNIKVLGEALRGRYDISFAKDGNKALEIVSANKPDLILLDIMMPGIDGYEVCRRLKAEKRSSDIPVIFISARDTEVDEAMGFECGAVDYITKPFRAELVKERVRTHLDLKRHRDHLNQVVKERTSQLIHSDRLATLGTISAAVAHEIKNPLFFISGNTELIQEYLKKGRYDKIKEKLVNILEGTRRIGNLTENLKGFSRKSSPGRLICSVREIVSDAVNIISYQLHHKNISCLIDDIEPDLNVRCDSQKMSQVFVNLISNSIDAIGENPGEIRIKALRDGDSIVISIHDNGPGIHQEKAAEIFEAFFTSKDKDHGTGLGLFIVRHIIEEHKGTIHIEETGEPGALFVIKLPCFEGDSGQ